MARATKWTDEKIKALRLPAKARESRVRVDAGLYLLTRARSDGGTSKHWQYRVQVDGARRWLALGEYPAVSLADARAELLRHERVREEAKKGEADHPALVARSARKATKAQPTVTAVFDEWIADKRLGSVRKGGEPVRDRTVKILADNFAADVQPRIGDSKIAHVTRAALQECIDAPRRRGAPGAAAQVYRTLRGLVNFAVKRGYVSGADPMRGIGNPRPYKPAPVNAASDAEILALLRALDASQVWPATKYAIRFQLLTGARPGEVRLARSDEIDEARATWTIPAERFKSGREFKVHLSPQALDVLQAARAIASAGKDGKPGYVFPGAKGAAMEKMSVTHTLARLAARAGRRLRPHDLRRTFRTMLARIGIAPHVAELCLGHIEKETMRRVYDGHDYAPELIAAWNRAGAHIDALLAGGAQVVALRAA